MRERIARALDEHEPELDQTACPTGHCSCGDKFSSEAALKRHRADAVIAALGLVEERRGPWRMYTTPWERIEDDA